MNIVNLKDKFSQFDDHWNPRIIGALNGQHIKAAKIKGEFVWHKHDHEDELFLVTKGKLIIELRDGNKEINEGEFLIVPRGVEHRPVAHEEVHLILFEPESTLNTGDAEKSELTKSNLEQL